MLACQIDIFVKAVTSNCRLWTFRSKKVKVTPVKSIMIFWNVILVNHLFFVWTETEINVTFHFWRLRQSTREKYCEYKWVIFRVDKCMDTFCIRIFYYSISQGFYSTIFYCRDSVSTWPWLSGYLSPLSEQYHWKNGLSS